MISGCVITILSDQTFCIPKCSESFHMLVNRSAVLWVNIQKIALSCLRVGRE